MYINKKIKVQNETGHYLIRKDTQLPLIFPLLYKVFRLRNKSVSTQKVTILAILNWYNYWAFKKHECFDTSFFNSKYDLEIIYPEFDGFLLFLSKSCKKSVKSTSMYLSCLKGFFEYLALRYTSAKYKSCNKEINHNIQFLRICNRLDSLFQYNEINALSLNKSWNIPLIQIDKDLLDKILNIVKPSSKLTANPMNPWKRPHIQLRNYIIISLLANYGLRIGEILSLTIHSIKPNLSGNGYSLIVTESNEEDSRFSKPLIKTTDSHRNIFLSPFHYELLSLYLNVVRLQSPTHHSFLFISLGSNRHALSYEQVKKIISKLSNVTKEFYPELLDLKTFKLTAHTFRHVWATHYLEYLVETERQDLEVAKDNLRSMGGWNMMSEIPTYYANEYISRKANKANQKRILKGL